jgi:hypothetical protein
MTSPVTSAAGRTEIKSNHYGPLCGQLRPCAEKWETIAQNLGFEQHEIASIKADPMKLMNAPESYMAAVIGKWSQWAPRDARGSKDYATLEALKAAVDSAGYSIVANKMTL